MRLTARQLNRATLERQMPLHRESMDVVDAVRRNDAWQGLAAEARALAAFLADRDPAVYRRYAHWWAKELPSAEVRLLPG
jgi:hypothetical protein